MSDIDADDVLGGQGWQWGAYPTCLTGPNVTRKPGLYPTDLV